MFAVCLFLFCLIFENSHSRAIVSNVENELAKVKLFYYASATDDVDISAPNNQLSSHFNPRKPLKVIIHGWNANRHQQALTPVQNAYQMLNKYNILAADWENISSKPYSTARELTRALGYRIGSILSAFMTGQNITAEQVHVVGHSLGAHIAGNVGKYFRGKLSRITALDPAGPLFLPLSTDAIDQSDAHFVDAIHTDTVLGEAVRRAHLDFYPNRGSTSQPGCELLDLMPAVIIGHQHSTRNPFLFQAVLLPTNVGWRNFKFTKRMYAASGRKVAEKEGRFHGRIRGSKLTRYLLSTNIPIRTLWNKQQIITNNENKS
nr:pancreatic lipase-related protein 2-like isoform X1 [Aedes albopictus]